MKKIYVMKVGTTFPDILRELGDFDAWTADALGAETVETAVVDAERGASLPPAAACAGVVITGSHAMVTDDLLWSLKMEEWIRSLLDADTPIFGICYGHQLLARAAGGRVGFHPGGMEIGTVGIDLLSESADDPLFQSLPKSFRAHATHSQTVLELPAGAICLAANRVEPHHAFRLKNSAWGVQFHPEYDVNIMQRYIQAQADGLAASGKDVAKLMGAVEETPSAAGVLKNFCRFVQTRN
jgi:GMP synthase (glutamine-hydrolysing)